MDLLTIEKKEKRRKHYWLFLVATYDKNWDVGSVFRPIYERKWQ